MSISTYIEKDGCEYFKVRIRRQDPIKKIYIDRTIKEINSLAEAEKIQKKLTDEVAREFFMAEHRTMKWKTLVDEWYEACYHGDIFTKTLGPGALEEYRQILYNYTNHWFELRVDEIDKAKAWLTLERMEREVSITRRKKLRTAIDSVYGWALLSGKLKGQMVIPTEGYKSNRKEEEKMPEILTLTEIRTLLKYAKTLDNPWYPIWALALFTGMRSGELYALKWDAIDFENKMIYVHLNWTNKTGYGPTKGRYWRAVPLGPQVEKFLKEQKLKTGKSGFVLPKFQSWTDGRQAHLLRTFCTGAGIPPVKFHTLRACFATQLIKDGVAPAVVMKVGGWKDLKTMQRYIRLAGIEVKGATDGLMLLPEDEVMVHVVNLFEREQ
jgi:integrase